MKTVTGNVVNFLDKVPWEYAQNIRDRAWGRFKQRQHRLQIERERQNNEHSDHTKSPASTR